MKRKTLIPLIIIISFIFGMLPSFAAPEISVKAPSFSQIIEQTYNDKLQKLPPIQQQTMKTNLWKLEKSIQKDPEELISTAYMVLVSEGASLEAQAVLTAWGAEKYPQSPCLLNNLGYVLSVLKENNNAETVYKRVLEIDSKRLETIINLGNLYLDTDRDEEAKARYESAIAIDKDYYKAWEGLWGYYIKKNDFAGALKIADKVLPGGFVEKGYTELSAEVAKKNENPVLENIKEGDSINEMDRKLDEISKSKPVTLVKIIENFDPNIAQNVKNSTENLGIDVKAPQNPWLYDYSDLENYYITVRGYAESSAMSDKSMDIDIDLTSIEQTIKELGSEASKDAIKKAAEDYAKKMQETLENVQNMDFNDLSKVMEAAKGINPPANANPFGPILGMTPTPQIGASISDNIEKVGVAEKSGMVTTGNYNNYIRHKNNFQKYMANSIKEHDKEIRKMGEEFSDEMRKLREKQLKQLEGVEDTTPFVVPHKTERNAVREKYLQKFNTYTTVFYRQHVLPGIEKIQNTQALYIKNMNNKKLRENEAQIMKASINGYLDHFASAKAPIDGYEPPVSLDHESEADRQLEERIETIKYQAPKKGETLPKLKSFEDGQRSLLEKIYEDTKFETSIAPNVKLKYENAELTLALNDPVSQEYMDLGVNLKEFSASLTEGKGHEVSFNVTEGAKGSALEGFEVEVGASSRQPGRKTTLFFDDNFNVVDARITSVPGSEGVSAQAGAGGVNVEGSLKIETTAEGKSQFVSGIKASINDVQILEKQYKEELAP